MSNDLPHVFTIKELDEFKSIARKAALIEAVKELQEFMEAETVRTEWDGSPGMLGNYIGGIRSSIALVQALLEQEKAN